MAAQIDPYLNYTRRLAGEKLPIVNEYPEAGFYELRYKQKNGAPPVRKLCHYEAYKSEFEDGLICYINGEIVEHGEEHWPRAVQHPISKETYLAVLYGGAWPNEHEAVTRDNLAPDEDSYEALRDRIDDLAREAKALCAKGAAKTQEDADAAADLAQRLSELSARADDARKKEKAPYDEGAREVQAKWSPLISRASIYADIKRLVTTPFLVVKEAALKAAQEKAIKSGEPAPTSRAAKVGTKRSQSLREIKIITIEDRAAVIAFFADSAPMTEFLHTSAERAVRAGVTVPGIKITIEKRAV